MKNKTFIKTAISLLLIALFLTAGVQIAIDPLFQYHMPWFGLKPVITDARYQVAGMAKTFEYDCAIIGNSMSQNFVVSDVNDVFGGNSVKLTMAGSYALDWTYLLRIVRDVHPKYILFNVSPTNLAESSKELVHEIPEYLFDLNCVNDVYYLFNFSVLSRFTYNSIKRNIKGDYKDPNTIFMWDDGTRCSKEQALESYTRPEISNEEPDICSYIQIIDENLDLLKSYITEMDDTQFVFFVSPYSMLYWDRETRTNGIEKQKAGYLEMCEVLTQYENVQLYMWTDKNMLGIMSDLDNYRDSNHYSKEVNKDILQRIKTETGLITKDNYQEEIDKLFEYITSFDYESLFT